MTRAPPRYPLVAIVGATGTGKSELAVELARRYNGEIINGDAMQLYNGLPIITNKITPEEQKGVPHHLLGCIGLEEQTWVVGDFVRRALETIDEIRSRGRLPILVGGTHYYTQSLLFRDRLAKKEGDAQEDTPIVKVSDEWPILQESTDVILEELKKVDPVMANRWHPNDRRKIQRSLAIFLQTGRRAWDIYAEQRQRSAGLGDPDSADNEALRFPTLLFWVHCEADVLRERLSQRVDKMFARGLLDEVRTLHAFAAAYQSSHDQQAVDETRGIWVSIGYKEFKPYITALLSSPSSPSSSSAPDLPALQANALERTKIATRQYAKSQTRWLRIKLLSALASAQADDHFFLLDASPALSPSSSSCSSSSGETFDSAVVAPALALTEKFLNGASLPAPATLSAAAEEMLVARRGRDLAAAPERWGNRTCEVCGTTCATVEQWEKHVASKAHKKLSAKGRRERGEIGGGD